MLARDVSHDASAKRGIYATRYVQSTLYTCQSKDNGQLEEEESVKAATRRAMALGSGPQQDLNWSPGSGPGYKAGSDPERRIWIG